MRKTKKDDVKILYICDRKKCIECHEPCYHTSDITHAVSFKSDYPNVYVESLISQIQVIEETINENNI